MAVFEEASWRDFRYTAFRYCREAHPELCDALGDQAVWCYVDWGLRKARAYGFILAADLCRYLALMFQLDPRFDELPWVCDVIADKEYWPASRLDYVERLAAQQLAEANS